MSANISPIVSVTLVALVALMVLIPPLAFARAFGRFSQIRFPHVGFAAKTAWLAIAVLPFAINCGYMTLAFEDLWAGNLELDENLAAAVMVSWMSFWGRVALGRKGLKRKREATISAQ